MNIKKIRSIADSLFDQQKYEDAFYLYDEIYNSVWQAIGTIQNGLSEFSSRYLGGSFKANYKLRSTFSAEISNSLFQKWFDCDNDEIRNEFIFTTYHHVQCIAYSPFLCKTISAESVYLEFLILQSLVYENENDDWIAPLLKFISPVVEDNHLKKLKMTLTDSSLKKSLIENAVKLKDTDWKDVNVCILDYLFNMGDNSSELYSSIYKTVGVHFHQKSHRKKSEKKSSSNEYYSYEKYERYERYERYQKFNKTNDDDFDPTKATDYEKSKYYGKILGLSGKVTKSYIRKKYLELIAKYHPDKVFDLGDELKILAEIKTKQINAAYEWMKKKYNI